MCVLSCFNRVQLFATPWTVARQVLQSMRFSRQEYWSGLPFPAPTFTLMTVSIKTRDTSTLQKPVVLILISFYKSTTFHICFFPIRLPTQLSLGHFILVFANSYSSTDQKTLECYSVSSLDQIWTLPILILLVISILWASLVVQLIKNPLQGMQETQIQPVGQEDLLAKEMAICSSNSCLENSMGQGAWQATVQGVTKSWTQLSMHRCTHISFQTSRFLYTTAHSSFLFEYLIRISKLFCTKLSLNILPPNNYFFLIAPQLIKCQLQFFQLLSQKPYNHP